MSIETNITAILGNPHAILRARGTSITPSGSSLLIPDMTHRVEALCWDARASINPGTNTIEFQAVALDTPGADAVIIGNQTEVAAAGQLQPPGFIFSDYFSGCIFYLARDDHGSLYGVHSYRSSGIYPDPMPYFNRLGLKLLYCFQTAGVFSTLGVGVFGSVLCYASLNKIVIDFVAIRGNGDVVQVVDHQRIDNWRAAPAIPAPVIGGAMAPYVPPVVPPAAMGLKKRVAKFLLKYI